MLKFQDPKYPNAPSLHESLLQVCKGARSGGGAFAFATKQGIDLVLRDDVFQRLATSGSFDLVIGVDAITNVPALTTLTEIRDHLQGLSVQVFLHSLTGSLFHPKFCWVRHHARGFLIVGSGNLTPKGLRGNWEAFTVARLTLDELDDLEERWEEWKRFHSAWLKPTDDADVLARAALNIQKKRPIVRGAKEPHVPIPVETDEDVIGTAEESEAALVAEIPKGQRWKQANFTLEIFRNFFGMLARGGEERRVLLQHVNSDGTGAEWENRPGVSVKSQNYRIELGAAAHLAYPQRSRPIGAFVRLASRTFRYRILMPNDPHYRMISAFLDANWDGPANRLRRFQTNVAALKNAWPDSPLWGQAD